jgi:OmpA-OmpF porin, OOP family
MGRRQVRVRCGANALRWCGGSLLVAAGMLWSPAARAQATTFYLDRLTIAGAPDDGIGIWRPSVSPDTRLFGQLGLGFALNPLRVDNHVDDRAKADTLEGNPVTAQFNSYFTAGIEAFERVSFQLSFPLTLYQQGFPTANKDVGLLQAVDLKPVSPMDLRLEGRVILFRTESRAFQLGLNGAFYAPSGNKFSFGGDGQATGAIGLASEYNFGPAIAIVNLGARLRPARVLHELTVSHELTFGAAGYVPLRQDMIRVGLEVFGATGISTAGTTTVPGDSQGKKGNVGDLDTSPLEWMASGRMFLTKKKQMHVGLGAGTRLTGGYAPDFRTVAVFGGWFPLKDTDVGSGAALYRFPEDQDTDKDGFPDNIDMCPVDAEDKAPPNPDDGCPTMPDRDGDGIPDVSDRCPDVKEDFDGVNDKDGCPEDDADKDNIPDTQDKCPKEPGERTGDTSKDGCPQYIRRVTGSSEIQIMKQVEFKFDSATILANSFVILDEVVRLLVANPEIKLVSIEGHTDNVGTVEYNDKLSKDRAKSVMNYLINKGIVAERLTSNGFGASKPLTTNDTPEGRQRNRRVEFHIKSQTIEGR